MSEHKRTNELKGKSLSLTNMVLPAHLDRLLVTLTIDKHDKSLELLSLIRSELSELESFITEMKKINP